MTANTGPTTWAAGPLDVDHAAVFSSFERAANVSLIATFDPELKCCSATEYIADVVCRSDFAHYDFLPVRRGEEIVGLLNRAEQADTIDTEPHRKVQDVMRPLDQSILMSSEASLLAFVASADAHPCRLVISEMRIDGIVTISDIQKLPVRPILFLLVTHFEMLMARVLRAVFPQDDGWLNHLKSCKRREAIEKRWRQLNDGEMEIDKLLATEFCDKKEAMIASIAPLPFGKSKAAKQIDRIEALRNGLAHAGEYAATRDAANRCAEAVRLTQSWIRRLNNWLSAHEHQSGQCSES